MLLKFKDLKNDLSSIIGIDLDEEETLMIGNFIENQVESHKKIKGSLPLEETFFYVIGKHIEGIKFIKVFKENIIPIEILDTSYTRMKNLETLEDWNIKFIFKVEYVGEDIKISFSGQENIIEPIFKEIEEVIYSVTDGTDYIKVKLGISDFEELDYKTLKDILTYSFNKKANRHVETKELNFILVNFK